MTALSPTFKTIKNVLPRPPQHWVGDAFHVYPVFHNFAFTAELSPWLMFDYAAPKEFGATSKRRGVGQHPHRGFETVTVAFQGAVEHADSVGNSGVIGPGDVQWMRAARGIIHEEYHAPSFAQNGGTFEMCQLWLNLPAKEKMSAPRYQPILSGDIPVVPLFRVGADPAAATTAAAAAGGGDTAAACEADGSVRVIAGSLSGVSGAADTATPVELFDVTLKTAGVPVDLKIPDGHNLCVFVRRGGVVVGDGDQAASSGRSVGSQGVAVMHRGGTILRLTATEAETQLLVLGGEPIDEPIAARGPFVMNTNAELQQAMTDYSMGRMGQ